MITFHIYTYLGDSALTPYCVRALRQAADRAKWTIGRQYRILVMDDASQPCRPDDKNACLDLGAEWRETTYWRRGNLNGHDCIVGILQDMTSAMTDETDIAIKVDVDTLILSLDWLEHILRNRPCDVATIDDRGNGYGMCYYLTGRAVRAVLDSLRTSPAGPMSPEDQTICYRARRLCGPCLYMPIPLYTPGTMPGSPNGPRGIAAPWLPDEPDRDYSRVQILNLRATFKPMPQEDILRAARGFLILE